MERRKGLLGLYLLLVLLAALSHIKTVSYAAEETPTMYVDPVISYAEVDQRFNVSVYVVDAVNIYSWQVNMTFDPTVLECINATEGDFLKTQPETLFYIKKSNTRGFAFIGCTIKGKYPGVDDRGIPTSLGKIEFKVLAQGECSLNITHPRTFLLRVYQPPLPPGKISPEEIIESNKEDGLFFNIEVPPKAEFIYSPIPPEVNQTITFNASASYATPPRQIVQYEWDFGDGTNATGMVVQHNYTKPDIYTVTLTVIDNATGTNLVYTMFGTTATMPHIWYELYSQAKEVINLRHEHDITIISVEASRETVTAGESVFINVTVLNNGLSTENFTVAAYFDENVIENRSVTGLIMGANETLTFTWDTTGVYGGTYTISAEAFVEGDGFPGDNVFVDGTIMVEGSAEFPLMLVVVGGVVVVGVGGGVGAFLFMRRKRAPVT